MARTRRAKLPTTTWYHLIARVTDRQFLLKLDEQGGLGKTYEGTFKNV